MEIKKCPNIGFGAVHARILKKCLPGGEEILKELTKNMDEVDILELGEKIALTAHGSEQNESLLKKMLEKIPCVRSPILTKKTAESIKAHDEDRLWVLME